MKHIFTFFTVLMMAMAMPEVASAYDFSAVSPSGHTLYYNINGNTVSVTYPAASAAYPGPWEGYTKPTGNLIIPSSVNYMGVSFSVTAIGDNAFYSCSEITSVSMPNTITSIGYIAFESCTNMTSVTIPSAVTNIGFEAFAHCSSLISITIPEGVTNIGLSTFSGCASLTSITIPSTVTEISDNAFRNCTSLTSVTIPNSVTWMTQYAFYESTNIEYLNFNNNTISPSLIPQNNLQTVVIGNDMTNIPANAFQNATNLSHVTIGSGVTSIGNYAFRFCTRLDTIVALPDIAPTLGTDVFQGTPNAKFVFINCNANYASAWSNTGFIYITGYTLALESNNALYGTASIVQPVDCQQTAIIQATPAARCVFTGWSDGNTENPRTITLTGNTTLMANFTLTREVVVRSANEVMGTTEGGGIHMVGSEVTLSAIATCGFRFTHWQDGEVSNPRTITLGDDTVFTAYFELHSDTVVMHDTAYMDVHDTTYIDVHDTTYIDVHDTSYVNVYVHDTTYINVPVHDTTIVTDTVTLTEYVTVHDTTVVTDTVTLTEYVAVHDTIVVTEYIHDTTTVTEYIHDTTTVIEYFHDTTSVYVEVHDTVWLTEYIHDTVYIHDTIVVGVDEVDAINAKVYSSQGQIVVEGADGNTVTLHDLTGRYLATKQDNYGTLRFDAPASGTYMIKIGNHAAKKVVVIK